MKKALALALILTAVIVVFAFKSQVATILKSNAPALEKNAEKKIGDLFNQEIKQPIFDAIKKKVIASPPPLRQTEVNPSNALLTKNGVFAWTNVQRFQNGSLPTLLPSFKLDQIAEARLKDMFANQYFEHVSPSGESASTEAKKINYEYVMIGENIALGNFENDQKLVEAWMNSPGHRANILNTRYQELGIAVGEDTFEGRKTWLGVQIFGKPLSSCPSIDQNLKSQIDLNKDKLDNLQTQASALKTEIESMNPQTKEEVKTYNQKVDVYNGLVAEINALISEVKSETQTYNSQINAFNACLSN
ncbi:MAG: CAP domain-containing protein [Candidatus Liptonbacteria bacterium]|nr:CAP domain-containing protein [Candidatus Liptonbacteria bacterium]